MKTDHFGVFWGYQPFKETPISYFDPFTNGESDSEDPFDELRFYFYNIFDDTVDDSEIRRFQTTWDVKNPVNNGING